MATTTRGIVYPVVGNTITPLATHFANVATSTDTAIGVVADATGRLIGTDAQRIALTGTVKRKGLSWYSTDTNREWEYDGANWIANDIGLYLVWPSSVTNATISADGTVIPNTAATSVSFNGVFSSRYRKYRIEFYYRTSATGGSSLNLRNAGADNTTANYGNQVLGAAGSSVAAAASVNNTTWPLANTSATIHGGTVEIINPYITGTVKLMKVSEYGVFNQNLGWRSGFLAGADASTFDGFTFTLSTGTFVSTDAWFKVYALA